MKRHAVRRRYEDVVMATRPVMYVPMQGNKLWELVRGVACNINNAPALAQAGPWAGSQAVRYSASTADDDTVSVTTNAAYHPGDTFSVGGWFNRRGQGDAANAPTIIHLGTNDFIVYFPLTGNTDKLTLRKAGVGDIFATNRTFVTPWADGWQHVIFAKNAGTSTVCYLNGVSAAGTYTNQTVVASASNVAFGSASGTLLNDFDGSTAHWAIWNRVITAAEAAELYRAGATAT